jgi:REP-associated tyrosine transposase
MSRPKRIALGGYIYHTLNRANGRRRIFRKEDDFLAFEQILAEGAERFSMRICGYCIMGNHWHLLLWPRRDGDLSSFMRWVSLTHTQRYHASRGTVGIGHLYQGRFKSFPVQGDSHYLTVLRYVETNPVRAGLVADAGRWLWSSFAVRRGYECPFELSNGPVPLPSNWAGLLREDFPQAELEHIEKSIKRGAPFGRTRWTERTAARLELQSTLRPRGRPRKNPGHEWR